MTTGKRIRTLGVLAGVLVLFVLGRFFGPQLFSNNWSFTHWQYLPWYVGPVWVVALAAGLFIAWRYGQAIGEWFEPRGVRLVSALILLVLFWLFRFDSFAYGGINVHIGNIAYADTPGSGVVVYRWFAFGSIMLADQLHCLLTSFDVNTAHASVLAWQIIAYVSVVVSMVAAWKIACTITDEPGKRVWCFAIAFFGPQTLLYFGYAGIGSIVVAFSMWIIALLSAALRTESTGTLAWGWLIFVTGLCFHISLIFLLPAMLYTTTVVIVRGGRQSLAPLLVGLVTLVLLVAAVYVRAGESLEVASKILLLSGKKPFDDYGLFSGRHIGDFVQMLFLIAPLIVLFKWLAFERFRDFFFTPMAVAAWLASAGGAVLVFVLDPVHSIVLDLPRFAAYLAPVGTAMVATIVVANGRLTTRSLASIAVAAALLPTSYLSVYTSLERTDAYASAYVEEHPDYYQPVAIAMRDAHFYLRDFQMAASWEQRMAAQSEQFLLLQGCLFLVGGGRGQEAIPRLYQLIAGNPYWWEPRTVLAKTQMSLGQPKLGKPQLDTALMLAPYQREPLVARYEYFRNVGQLDSALVSLDYALEYFPADTFIRTDQMLLELRAGDYRAADSLADDRLAQDSLHAHAWYVKGVLADRAGQVSQAIGGYRRFLEIGPADPDTNRVRRRMETLEMALEQ